MIGLISSLASLHKICSCSADQINRGLYMFFSDRPNVSCEAFSDLNSNLSNWGEGGPYSTSYAFEGAPSIRPHFANVLLFHNIA